MPEDIDLSQPTRQSAWAPIFIAGRLVRRIGLANLGFAAVALISGRVPQFILSALVLGAVALAGVSLALWWRRVFSIVDGELIAMKGLVNLERITIPLDRIQSVNLDQQLLHRPIGLVRARIQTAGSQGTEFEFEALDRSTAEALRTQAVRIGAAQEASDPDRDPAAAVADASTPGETEVLILRRTPMELVKVALSRNPLADLAFIGPFYLVVREIADSLGFSEEDVVDAAGNISLPLIVLIPIGIVLYLIVFGSIWIGSTFLRHFALTMWRQGDRLRTTSGLLTTVERSSSFDRIQMVRLRRNPLHRRWGIGILSLPTASATGGGADSMTVPGTTSEEAARLTGMLLPDDVPEHLDSISEKAVQRWQTWIGAAPGLTGVAVGWFVVGPWSLLGFAWIGVVVLLAPRVQRRWSYGLSSQVLEIRHGLVTHHVDRLAIRKTQAVTIERAIFHRRNGLANVVVHTAAGKLTVPHIDVDTALSIRDRIVHRTQTDVRAWM